MVEAAAERDPRRSRRSHLGGDAGARPAGVRPGEGDPARRARRGARQGKGPAVPALRGAVRPH